MRKNILEQECAALSFSRQKSYLEFIEVLQNPPLGETRSKRKKLTEVLLLFLLASDRPFHLSSIITTYIRLQRTAELKMRAFPSSRNPGWMITSPTQTEPRIILTDRDTGSSGKACGCGLCVYISTDWFGNIGMITKHCSLLVEFVAVTRRPYYLLRNLIM